MLGVAAQRIALPIRKPRNNADEAIRPPRVEERSSRPRRGPPRVEERSSRPRRRPHIRALQVAGFGPTLTRAEPKPGGTGPHLATEGRSAVSRRSPMGPTIGFASLRASHPGKPPSRPRGAYAEVP